MNARDLDTKESQFKWFAARDARMRSIANASHFSEAKKIRAERLKLVLDLVYANRGIHINYRKTKIAVKVDAAQVKDRKNLAICEADWAAEGIVKTQSAQGVIYSFA